MHRSRFSQQIAIACPFPTTPTSASSSSGRSSSISRSRLRSTTPTPGTKHFGSATPGRRKRWTRTRDSFREFCSADGTNFDDLRRALAERDWRAWSPRTTSLPLLSRAELLQRPTATWESLLLLCTGGHYEAAPDQLLRSDVAEPLEIVLETQTLDSFLCAFLEVLWGCGGSLQVSATYAIDDLFVTLESLFHAFFLLRELARHRVLERYATLDPLQFSRDYAKQPKQWLAARHWYSTLVDVLTAQRQGAARVGRHRYAWTPPEGTRLELAALPYSGFAAARTPHPNRDGVACWGEWHLAVLAGSKTPRCRWSSSSFYEQQRHLRACGPNAALPTVEAFYERYADLPCLRLPERQDVSLPRLTYKELRDRVFSVARSRTTIFDFRHCMRELHTGPDPRSAQSDDGRQRAGAPHPARRRAHL